jgi:hypothetical protein
MYVAPFLLENTLWNVICDYAGEAGGNMLEENTTVTIYLKPDQVQEGVKELEKFGFDLKRVSVIGGAYRDHEELIAYYKQGDKLTCWGDRSEFWNGLFGRLREWALFSCPGTGSLLVVGPVAVWVVAVLNNSAIFAGMSALGATLYSMGLARDRVQDCEEALRKGSYLLIVHGPAEKVSQAKRILKSANFMLSNKCNKK